MLNVVLDARMAFHTGIGRYVRSLASALAARPDVELALLVDPARAEETRAGTGVRETRPYPAPIYSVAEQLRGPGACRAARRGRPGTVFHFPHYNAPWLAPRPSVVTVHDLIQLGDPRYYGRLRSRLARSVLRRAVRNATHVIAVSAATRAALERVVPEARGRVTTIHHGVGAPFRPLDAETVRRFRERHGIGRCLLFVGGTRPHKNRGRVLEAFRLVRERHPDVSLAVVDAAAQASPGVRPLGPLTDDDLAHWYNAAAALVMPSLEEGFGLPALEALACGTPVIVARRPAQREVVGDTGLAVDPLDVAALAAAMTRLLDAGGPAPALRERGLRRARELSWEHAAGRTVEVYREAAALPSRAGR